ncbi:MAG: S-layer protein [Paenibacillus sp.]|nr:S-layer protein [Paenibacillus sp.]
MMHKKAAVGLALILLLAANTEAVRAAGALANAESGAAMAEKAASDPCEAPKSNLPQTQEAEPTVAYKAAEQEPLQVALSFQNNEAFAGEERAGIKRGDTYYFNLNVVAAAFGFNVEAFGTDGSLKVENADGYGFTVSKHPVSTLYWEGRAVRTVALQPFSLYMDEAQQPYIAQPNMEALFGLRMDWADTYETAELVFPLFSSEFVDFPESLDGDTLRMDAQIRTSGAHSGPLLRLYQPDAVENQDSVSSFELVRLGAEYPYKAAAALPLQPESNRVWALLQMNERIVAAAEREVYAHFDHYPLNIRSVAPPMIQFSRIEWNEPKVGYAISNDGGVALNGQVCQAVGDELTVMVEKWQNGAFVRAAKHTIPLTDATFERFIRWPGGPGLYRFRVLSASVVHHGQTGSAEIARFYAEYPKPTEQPDGEGATEEPANQEEAPQGVIEQDSALQMIAELGIIPDGYWVKEAHIEQQSASFVNGRRQIDPFHPGRAFWVIRYASADGSGADWRVQLDAASGKLINFYREDPIRGPMYNPAVSYEEAKAIAETFAARVNGEIYEQLGYDDSREYTYTDPLSVSMPSAYGISYYRVVNGIPYPQNSIHVTVDENGTIISYSYNWSDSVRFEDPVSAMDPQQAEQALYDRMVPTYLVPLDRPENARAIYEFFPEDQLEAASGRFLDMSLSPFPDVGRKPVGDKPLSPPPTAPVEPLTQEEAAALAKTIMNLPADSLLWEVHLNGNLWQLNFKPGGSDSTESALVILNRLTGLPMNYYHFRPPTGQSPILTRQQASEKAEQFLGAVMPYAVNELYRLDDEDKSVTANGQSGSYVYTYRQIRNGVLLGDIRISVNPGNGEVVEFADGTRPPRAVTAPPASFPEFVPPEQAYADVLEHNRLELVYVSPYEPRTYAGNYADALAKAKDTDPSSVTARLVYRWKLSPPYKNAAVDAQSGQWIERRFGEYVQEP